MAAEALEKSVLESKDKEQLFAIAQALGIKTTARAAKATLIDKIIESTSAGPGRSEPALPAESAATGADNTGGSSNVVAEVVLGPDGEPLADWEVELLRAGEASRSAEPAEPADRAGRRQPATRTRTPAPTSPERGDDSEDEGDEGDEGEGDGEATGPDGESRNSRRRRRRRNKGRIDGDGTDPTSSTSPDAPRDLPRDQPRDPQRDQQRDQPRDPQRLQQRNGGQSANPQEGQRNGGAGRLDRPERDQEVPDAGGLEPVEVSGYLDLRDEGYGFLRVNGYLASRDDAYIPVKLTRQYGLRKGDHVTGLSRPAGRNEKNPALLEIQTINGMDPDLARHRPRFDDLTALSPDVALRLENSSDPNNMTARIIDLLAPIGKGQRGIVVSPPMAGKTTIMKTIATSIEKNHPEVKLMVLLIDERPEDVTDMRRTVQGEVISSTFDRPSEEHTHVAELVIERAKRLVEMGEDVVIILDGITRLSRAYNLSAPPTGRALPGGIDAGALHPPKKFFGAARNIEAGGSLTILATALVEGSSRMDDAIFEELAGTGNMELRLDRRLAERRIYPAIDVEGSSTRREELLFDPVQLAAVWKLRRVLAGLVADDGAASMLEALVERLTAFGTNAELLAELTKQLDA